MKFCMKIIFPMLALFMLQTATAKTKFSSAIQTSLTSGETSTTNDTYIGLWYLGKINIGINRNSLISFGLKAGGQNHNDSDSNKTDVELYANYLYQPNSGYFSPTYGLKINISEESFSSQTIDKHSVSFSMYKPISNKIEYGLTFRLTEKDGFSEVDTQSFIVNFDYFHNPQTIFYSSFIFSDEESSAATTSGQSDPLIDTALVRKEIAGSHLPGEPGYVPPVTTSTTTSTSNHVTNSDNTSLILGAIYTIDDKQSIDIAFIKHFYDTSTDGSSSSHYLAMDYFYKF